MKEYFNFWETFNLPFEIEYSKKDILRSCIWNVSNLENYFPKRMTGMERSKEWKTYLSRLELDERWFMVGVVSNRR